MRCMAIASFLQNPTLNHQINKGLNNGESTFKKVSIFIVFVNLTLYKTAKSKQKLAKEAKASFASFAQFILFFIFKIIAYTFDTFNIFYHIFNLITFIFIERFSF